jgi:hypothetical protein
VDPADVSVSVHFRLPARQYDLTHKQAERDRLPLAEWSRRLVVSATTRRP